MKYLGDFKYQQTVTFTFLSVDDTKAPVTLSGSPAISVYSGSSLTQSTAGVTLTVNFDGVIGLNHVAIVTTNAFYAVATDFRAVITTGTSGGISVVGTTVAEWSIQNRASEDIEVEMNVLEGE